MLRRDSLLLLLANAIPVWIFAQGRTHTFSSREFHYQTATASTAVRSSNVWAYAFQLNITTSPVTCDAANGLLTIEPVGGTAPYARSHPGCLQEMKPPFSGDSP